MATRDVDEYVDLYNRLSGRVVLYSATRAPFWIHVNGARLGRLWMMANSFAGDAEAGVDAVEAAYKLLIPLSGCSTIDIDKTRVHLGVGTASITSPGHAVRSNVTIGYASLSVGIPQAAMTRALAAFEVVPPSRPLQFAPKVPLMTQSGAMLDRLVRHAAQTIDDGLMSPRVGESLSDALIYGLLEHLPHSYSALLARPTPKPAPRVVRLVEAFICANLDQPLAVTDIAMQLGISARAIAAGFRAYRGISVLQFVRERRLALARKLLSTGTYATVAEVALACGCSHLGRFSVRYREAFGETAKATLERARRA